MYLITAIMGFVLFQAVELMGEAEQRYVNLMKVTGNEPDKLMKCKSDRTE
jgi:hypothetical protein